MAVGVASLVFGDFDPGQPVAEHLPARIALAYAAGAFMVVAAAGVEWRRTAAWAAAALTIYYTLFVVILMNGRLLLTDYAVYVTYENVAMQLAIAAGALIIYATTATIDAALAASFPGIDCNPLYLKMNYIRHRLTNDPAMHQAYSDLCRYGLRANSKMDRFWRFSNHLPLPLFQRAVDLLLTQSVWKQIVHRAIRGKESV